MIQVEKINNHFVVSFAGQKKLNIVIANDLKARLLKIIATPNRTLILDLDGIKFIDSEGFNVLISLLKAAENNNCAFKICNVSDEINELIELVELQDVFMICENSFTGPVV